MDLVEVAERGDSVVKRHPWELARIEVVDSMLKKIIKDESNFDVLDIGCGDIFFIETLSARYPKVNFYAIDIAFTDEMLAKLKLQSEGKNIFIFKTLEEAGAQLKKPADLVLLLDVVEHIEKDKEFLSSLSTNKVISGFTKIVITVPAFQSLFCSHDYFLGHYKRYTNDTLLKLINESGYESKEIGYFFSSLILPRILQVIKEKFTKPNFSNQTTGLVEWNKGKILTHLFKNILIIDYLISKTIKKLTGSSLVGLSNYIICQKPV